MRISVVVASGCLLLCSCASVQFQALTPAGQPDGAPGLRYYLPRPYLLVTEIPARWAAATEAGNNNGLDGTVSTATTPGGAASAALPAASQAASAPQAAAGNKHNQRPGGLGTHVAGGARNAANASSAPPNGTPSQQGNAQTPGQGGDKSDSTDPSASKGNGASPPPADVSYALQISQYEAKVIYLPDFSHPMTMTVSAGFGSAAIQPTLVDGWMLTSMQANIDSQTGPILASLASLITSVKSPAPAAAASGNSKSTAGGARQPTNNNAPTLIDRGLPPGLYAFDTDATTGIIVRVCAVTFFSTDHGDADSTLGSVHWCRRDASNEKLAVEAFKAEAAASEQ